MDGKAHAMWTAARQADSDWLLFTDADVMFRPDCLRAPSPTPKLSAPITLCIPPHYHEAPGEKNDAGILQ